MSWQATILYVVLPFWLNYGGHSPPSPPPFPGVEIYSRANHQSTYAINPFKVLCFSVTKSKYQGVFVPLGSPPAFTHSNMVKAPQGFRMCFSMKKIIAMDLFQRLHRSYSRTFCYVNSFTYNCLSIIATHWILPLTLFPFWRLIAFWINVIKPSEKTKGKNKEWHHNQVNMLWI